jgi:hypothetical protein
MLHAKTMAAQGRQCNVTVRQRKHRIAMRYSLRNTMMLKIDKRRMECTVLNASSSSCNHIQRCAARQNQKPGSLQHVRHTL